MANCSNCEKAARASMRGNLLFFVCVLLALVAGAFGVTAENRVVLIVGLVACGLLLVLACVLVYLHSRIADKYKAKAREDAARAKAAEAEDVEASSEDGLPGAFCQEIRGYSPAQLRLILDEQKDEYSAEEYAFIEKVLAEKA